MSLIIRNKEPHIAQAPRAIGNTPWNWKKIAAISFIALLLIEQPVFLALGVFPLILTSKIELKTPMIPHFDPASVCVVKNQWAQDFIDRQKFQVPLILNPPEPEDISLDQEHIEKWVNSHEDPVRKELAKEAVNKTTIVSARNFNAHLCRTIDSFERAVNGEKYAILFYDKKYGSSNLWILEKSLPYLSHLPEAIIHKSQMELFPHIRHFAYFDDGCYSGQQAGTAISGGDGHFHYVIPFGSARCKRNVMFWRGKDSTVHFHFSWIMPSLKDVFHHDLLARKFILEKNYLADASDKQLIVFAHKMPDLTSVEIINRGMNLIKTLTPPYYADSYFNAHKNKMRELGLVDFW